MDSFISSRVTFAESKRIHASPEARSTTTLPTPVFFRIADSIFCTQDRQLMPVMVKTTVRSVSRSSAWKDFSAGLPLAPDVAQQSGEGLLLEGVGDAVVAFFVSAGFAFVILSVIFIRYSLLTGTCYWLAPTSKRGKNRGILSAYWL